MLDEVVNVGKGIKRDSTKHQKSQTWMETTTNKENSGSEGGGKDGATYMAFNAKPRNKKQMTIPLSFHQ